MAVHWLAIVVVGLAAIEVSYQAPEDNFANPPPLPTAGKYLHINNAYHKLGNFCDKFS